MIKRSFFGFSRPALYYERVAGVLEPLEIPASDRIILLLEESYKNGDSALIKEGDKVKTHQKLALYQDSDSYVISSCTGTIESISPYIGYMGNQFTQITIKKDDKEEFDNLFQTQEQTAETAAGFLANLPGSPCVRAFLDPEKPIDTIVISCIDKDLQTVTCQYAATERIEFLKKGIEVLKKIAGIDKIILAVPQDRIQGYGHIGAKVKKVSVVYPAGNPRNIIKDIVGRVVPAQKSWEDVKVAFLSAEGAASIGAAFDLRTIPCEKLITFIDKQGNKSLASVKIGTRISDVLKGFDVSVEEGDRIIIGGPMTGTAIYSEDHPVCPDTDAVIVQAADNIPLFSDYPCINCGECVKVCPAKIQVNLLVRFLEAGQYEEAAELYDLHACIDCGLCAYVCVSKIPVFQYIQLGKHELKSTVEVTDEQNEQ